MDDHRVAFRCHEGDQFSGHFALGCDSPQVLADGVQWREWLDGQLHHSSDTAGSKYSIHHRIAW